MYVDVEILFDFEVQYDTTFTEIDRSNPKFAKFE